MARALRRAAVCLNCGHAVDGNFCPECGQENTDYRVSLRRLVGDLADELFQVESRLWRSLWNLLRRPGLLSVEYNAGRRVRYTTPLRLYLISSVTYFFVAGVMPNENVKVDLGNGKAAQAAPVIPEAKLPKNALVRRFVLRAEEVQKDPQGASRRAERALTAWAPRIAAGLVPLLAFLTWLLFRRPKLYFVEHLVLALHAHATGFLLLLVAELARHGLVGLVAFIAMMAWSFLALRRVFGQSRLRTGLKLATISAVYGLFVAFGIAAAAVAGAFATA